MLLSLDYHRNHDGKSRFFKGVLGTRFGSLELKIGSLESEKSGPYSSIPGILSFSLKKTW